MLTQYTKKFVRYLRNTKAISALEYAILLGVISVALVAALTTFMGDGTSGISGAIKQIGDNIKTNTSNTGNSPAPPAN